MVFPGEERLGKCKEKEDPEQALKDAWNPEAPSPRHPFCDETPNDRSHMWAIRHRNSVNSKIETAFSLIKQIADCGSAKTEGDGGTNPVKYAPGDYSAIARGRGRSNTRSPRNDSEDDIKRPSTVDISERNKKHRTNAGEKYPDCRGVGSLLDHNTEVLSHLNKGRIWQG